MPKLIFQPESIVIEADENTKVLAAANRNKVQMRFGCASCRCGTCAVKVSAPQNLSPMKSDEKSLMERMKLITDGTVRLACQARIMADTVEIDLTFQDTYSPDQGDLDEED
jgi:ferredoxin